LGGAPSFGVSFRPEGLGGCGAPGSVMRVVGSKVKGSQIRFLKRSLVLGCVFKNEVAKFILGCFLKLLTFDREILKSFAKSFRHLVVGILRSSKDGEFVSLRDSLVPVHAIQA
jgi:hypothetical protein